MTPSYEDLLEIIEELLDELRNVLCVSDVARIVNGNELTSSPPWELMEKAQKAIDDFRET
jgi:hypothetical protein